MGAKKKTKIDLAALEKGLAHGLEGDKTEKLRIKSSAENDIQKEIDKELEGRISGNSDDIIELNANGAKCELIQLSIGDTFFKVRVCNDQTVIVESSELRVHFSKK